ncbi:MAG TPA: hypothetical protein VK633_08750 [Verrucomicrobiae bacterium]|nr:hypothetical protein [Verrucomicrobiae bacterium]
MSTVAEIVEAVKQLSPTEKRELIKELESVFSGALTNGAKSEPADYLSAEFTTRLVEHFHKAKRAALGQS